MQSMEKIDIKEDFLAQLSPHLLEKLLFDHTTNRNIVWATSDYARLSYGYAAAQEITISKITGYYCDVIQPRTMKAQHDQTARTRAKAEVFTPSWICNQQNNLIDEQWFGRPNVFNIPDKQSWLPVTEPIQFAPNRTWMEYVDAKRLEITCGEAPYLTSRYDTVTGLPIPLIERIGLLDRKLRIVNENTNTQKSWWQWTQRAFQSIYGYEYQGDNLLLARENLLCTFADYTKSKWYREPTTKELEQIAEIISWNLWQMDGLTYMVPFGKAPDEENVQCECWDDFPQADQPETPSLYCVIRDWTTNETIEYRTMLGGGKQ